MSHLSSSSSKRSRWGGPPPPQQQGNDYPRRHNHNTGNEKSVSEEEALKALLSSAAAQQEEKDQRKRPAKSFEHERKPPHRNNSRFRGEEGNEKDDNNYYGPSSTTNDRREGSQRNTADHAEKDDDKKGDEQVVDKQKPNFGLSGALAKDSKAGNVYKGVVLKFREPPEARAPNTLWRFYVFKGEEQLDTLHVSRQSAYLFGRNEEIADIVLQHPSCSSQHAVLQYRALSNPQTGKLSCHPYLMDLESTNGSFINGVRIDSARYYQLKKGDVLKFGASTREYVLLTANTTSVS